MCFFVFHKIVQKSSGNEACNHKSQVIMGVVCIDLTGGEFVTQVGYAVAVAFAPEHLDSAPIVPVRDFQQKCFRRSHFLHFFVGL